MANLGKHHPISDTWCHQSACFLSNLKAPLRFNASVARHLLNPTCPSCFKTIFPQYCRFRMRKLSPFIWMVHSASAVLVPLPIHREMFGKREVLRYKSSPERQYFSPSAVSSTNPLKQLISTIYSICVPTI